MDSRNYTFENVELIGEDAKNRIVLIANHRFAVSRSQIQSFNIKLGRLVTTRWWADHTTAREKYEWHHDQLRQAEAKGYEAGRQDSKGMGLVAGQLRTAKKVYLQLIKKWHPDKNPMGAEITKDINQLWQAVGHDLALT